MAQITQGATIYGRDFYDTFFERFAKLANQNIVYGTNNRHFSDMPQNFNDAYGGTTAGITQGSETVNGLSPGNTIDDAGIKDYIIGQSVIYCRIRNVSVKRNVLGDGGAIASSSTAVGISNMNSSFAAPGFSNPGSTSNIAQGNTIFASQLTQFINDCYTQYSGTQRVNTLVSEYNVCHTSCHNACHSSGRGRR